MQPTRKNEPANSTIPRRQGSTPLLALLAFAGGGWLLYRNGESWLRSLLLYLSSARWARSLVTGFPPAWKMASRFVAGESIDEAIEAARQLNGRGLSVALDFLGESVETAAEANAARDQIVYLIERVDEANVDAYISLKLSQLGLKLDENLAVNNLRMILQRARSCRRRVRIDMEESALVDVTLDIYRRLRFGEAFDNVGVVIQAALFRSESDVQQLIAEGAAVRLVKGAYKEPPDIAFAKKAGTDANMVRLLQIMLGAEARGNGVELAIASHDEAIITAAKDFAQRQQIDKQEYEFQLLYGIRRDLQEQLAAQGYRVRVYVPYGTAWYPYFMRRLAERPANLWFFVTNLLRQ